MYLIFGVLDVLLTMGLTLCYKTEGFFTFIVRRTEPNAAETFIVGRCKCRQSSLRPTVHSEEKFRRKIYLHDPAVTRRFGYIDECSRADSSAPAAAAAAIRGQRHL